MKTFLALMKRFLKIDFSYISDVQSVLEISGLSMIDKGCDAVSSPFYISVYGISASIFSLTVHPTSGGSAVALLPGLPLFSSIGV